MPTRLAYLPVVVAIAFLAYFGIKLSLSKVPS
jgi:hypothetical protein